MFSVYLIEPNTLPNKSGQAVSVNIRWSWAASAQEAQDNALDNHNIYCEGGSADTGEGEKPYASWDAMVAAYAQNGYILFTAQDNPEGGLLDQSEV